MFSSAEDAPLLPEAAAVVAWSVRRAEAPRSEAASRGYSDAIALDMLDPLALPETDASRAFSAVAAVSQVLQLMTSQPKDVANRAAEASKAGARALLTQDCPPRRATAIILALFDYAARQLHGVAWAAAYTTSDSRPAACLERLRRFSIERLADPPPLIVVLDGAVYTVRRRREEASGIGGILRHTCGAEALAEWLVTARSNPIVSDRMSLVLSEVLEPTLEDSIMSADLPLIPIEES
jgi:hypothetical protein